ncbi:MAG TPA: hypothetical protein VMS56_03800 [Thermoanaerobaculia bacterium]|nr:hypothetical protein [Thermoanaerobaculia bacterium]
MYLALFLIETAAGLQLTLPLVRRRDAGVKYYRLILIVVASLGALAAVAHAAARRPDLAGADASLVVAAGLLWLVLRYPKRPVYRLVWLLAGIAGLAAPALAWHHAVLPLAPAWSAAGAWSATALLGTVSQAMLLGHWYLVVRGMSIDPLLRLCRALLACSIVRLAVVGGAIALLGSAGWGRDTPLWELVVRQGIFFWMRVGWGLLFPLALWPMIWGTARIRSTMAATGILYVAVVAVVIGEVLAIGLSSGARLPV